MAKLAATLIASLIGDLTTLRAAAAAYVSAPDDGVSMQQFTLYIDRINGAYTSAAATYQEIQDSEEGATAAIRRTAANTRIAAALFQPPADIAAEFTAIASARNALISVVDTAHAGTLGNSGAGWITRQWNGTQHVPVMLTAGQKTSLDDEMAALRDALDALTV